MSLIGAYRNTVGSIWKSQSPFNISPSCASSRLASPFTLRSPPQLEKAAPEKEDPELMRQAYEILAQHAPGTVST